MAQSVAISTTRLRLRSWRAGDENRFDEACNTAVVMKWLGGTQTRRQLEADVRHFIKHEDRHGHTFWVVEHRVDGRFLGFCGIVRINERDCPFGGATEIGWRIREDAWRNGFAYEAAQAVLRLSFGEFALSTVVSRVARKNKASRGLMRKLGMKRRSELDYEARDGTDLAVYSITREKWLSVGREG
jgi:RimJ/RimL family protein N-acetyltransferase